MRLIDEFLAKAQVGNCGNFGETAEVIAKVGFKMFLGITAEVVGVSEKEFSLQLQHDVDDAANRGNVQRWPAKLTIKDRYERLVLLGMGVVTCGPQVASPDATGTDRSR